MKRTSPTTRLTMTTTDLNEILSSIRSAREGDDDVRLALNFLAIPAERRAEFSEFAGVECDEDGDVEMDVVRDAIKGACELDATSGNADVFAMLDALLSTLPKWSRAFEAAHLGHYAVDEEIDPNEHLVTLVLGENANWIEPCDHADEARLDAPTWDADEGSGTIVCAFPVRGQWVAWVEYL